MAQFDVHRNIGLNKQAIPFVVIVQSSLFDKYRRIVVVPLIKTSDLKNTSVQIGTRLNPAFSIASIDVVLHPLEIVSIAIDQLGEKITTLVDEGGRIADALDEVFTRSWL